MNQIEVMDQVIKDVEGDIKVLEGSPFTGPAIARQFGYQAAAICAIAKAVKYLLLKEEQKCQKPL